MFLSTSDTVFWAACARRGTSMCGCLHSIVDRLGQNQQTLRLCTHAGYSGLI